MWTLCTLQVYCQKSGIKECTVDIIMHVICFFNVSKLLVFSPTAVGRNKSWAGDNGSKDIVLY